jgi:hypothetical protein
MTKLKIYYTFSLFTCILLILNSHIKSFFLWCIAMSLLVISSIFLILNIIETKKEETIYHKDLQQKNNLENNDEIIPLKTTQTIKVKIKEGEPLKPLKSEKQSQLPPP